MGGLGYGVIRSRSSVVKVSIFEKMVSLKVKEIVMNFT